MKSQSKMGFNRMRSIILVLFCLGLTGLSGNNSLGNSLKKVEIRKSIDCPKPCTCRDVQTVQYVSCTNKGLSVLPQNLPINTETLVLSSNSFKDFPDFARDDSSLLPNFKVLRLDSNILHSIQAKEYQYLDVLETLELRYNRIKHLFENNFKYLPSLKYLGLKGNHIRNLHHMAFASNTLAEIHLGQNRIRFASRLEHVFRRTPMLNALDISENAVTYTFMKNAFQNMTLLKQLYISSIRHAQLRYIPSQTFRNVTNLIVLEMNDNSLSSLNRNDFEDLVSLKKLGLNNNFITGINQTTFPPKLLNSLEKLDLSGNLFQCDCSLLWMVDWMKANHEKLLNFDKSPAIYKCNAPEKMLLKDFHLDPYNCLNTKLSLGLKVAMASQFLLVSLVLLLSSLYRWRWKLRYRLFHFFSWWTASQKMMRNQDQVTDYIYDAFICYNSEDSEWVNEVLLPELEQKCEPAFKLCLYERDWLVGQNIINCIGESIESSRKIILIVTNSFARSQWCHLELTMAQHHLFETDQDNLIIAVMEDIEACNMTPRLVFEMKRRTYLAWTNDADGQRLFWEKLKAALQQPLTSVRGAVPPIEDFCQS